MLDRRVLGNLPGWIISGVLVGATGVFLFILHRFGQPSPAGPIGRMAESQIVRLPIEPISLAGFMTEDFDPSLLYRQAIAAYQADQRLHGPLAIAPTVASEYGQLWRPALDPLVRASKSRMPAVFRDRPAELINYDPDKPTLSALTSICRAGLRLALLYLSENGLEQSQELAQAIFALGARLYHERLTFAELDLGLELLGESASLLIRLAERAGQDGRAESFRRFNTQRVEHYTSSILPVMRVIATPDPNVGDLLALASRAGDPVYRTEAVLALGRARYSAGRGPDQTAATRAFESMLNSKDERIRLASAAARNLTLVQFRRLR